MGLADKTLSEFIIELSKGKTNVREFRLELRENGADMPDALVSRCSWGGAGRGAGVHTLTGRSSGIFDECLGVGNTRHEL